MTFPLVWLDLETTGTDPQRDHILEVAWALATIEDPFTITARDSFVLPYELPSIGDHHDPKVLDMHAGSGLWAACEAERRRNIGTVRGERNDARPIGLKARRPMGELLSLKLSALAIHLPTPDDYGDRATLAGNSVHFDLSFLRVHAPDLAALLSHRVYDVSSVGLFCRSLGMPKIEKRPTHRAAADIDESIRQAKLCAQWMNRHQAALEEIAALGSDWVGEAPETALKALGR